MIVDAMASTGAQAATADIFNEAQVREIERVILLTIGEAGQRASQELKTAQEAIVESGQQLYAKTTQFGAVQEDIKSKMEEFNAERLKMVDEMKSQHADFAKVREDIAGYVIQKDQLVQEVTSKCAELDNYTKTIKTMMEQSMAVVREASGGLREEMSMNFDNIRTSNTRNDEAIRDLYNQVRSVQMHAPRAPEAPEYGDAGQHAGNAAKKSLLYMRDLKNPPFPETDSKGNVSSEVFRK